MIVPCGWIATKYCALGSTFSVLWTAKPPRYDGPVLADAIGGYWFNGRTLIGYVDIQNGDDVDFQVSGGFYPSEYSYRVEDEEGNVIVDQVEQYEPAEDVLGVVICTLSDIAETDGLARVQFVPNPTAGSVRLTGLFGSTSWTLTVQTLLGQTVLATEGTGQQTVDLSSLSAGTYVGQLLTGDGAATSLRLVVR